jgi:hypothetical protein
LEVAQVVQGIQFRPFVFIAPFWPGSIEIKHWNIQSDNIDNARLTRSAVVFSCN